MNRKELLFYDAYEAFYTMAGRSNAFRTFCRDAFGEDFSQDGFSDLGQIDRILSYIPQTEPAHILDIGCGNGKMLGYLQKKTGAHIYGFDYSEAAIRTARHLFRENAHFRVGVIGDIEYPTASFDVIVSMDTMYFAKDMAAFTAQVKQWLKPGGVFFVGYQEGEVMPKTEDRHTTRLAEALALNGMEYDAVDITEPTYELLKAKRAAALAHQTEFEAEGSGDWFDLLMAQTECAAVPYEQFREKMARYLYTARTGTL